MSPPTPQGRSSSPEPVTVTPRARQPRAKPNQRSNPSLVPTLGVGTLPLPLCGSNMRPHRFRLAPLSAFSRSNRHPQTRAQCFT
jgi:hypothetical protein